jgi:hypothetical protein
VGTTTTTATLVVAMMAQITYGLHTVLTFTFPYKSLYKFGKNIGEASAADAGDDNVENLPSPPAQQ